MSSHYHIPPTLGQVRPGVLVSNWYTPELGLIVRIDEDSFRTVDVLLASGAIVTWGMDGFRQTYEVIG